jgi:hypothetical protein
MAFRNFLDGAALSYLKNTDPDTEEIVQIELEVSIYKTSSTSNKLVTKRLGFYLVNF